MPLCCFLSILAPCVMPPLLYFSRCGKYQCMCCHWLKDHHLSAKSVVVLTLAHFWLLGEHISNCRHLAWVGYEDEVSFVTQSVTHKFFLQGLGLQFADLTVPLAHEDWSTRGRWFINWKFTFTVCISSSLHRFFPRLTLLVTEFLGTRSSAHIVEFHRCLGWMPDLNQLIYWPNLLCHFLALSSFKLLELILHSRTQKGK